VRIVLTRRGKLPKKAKIFDTQAPAWVFKGQPLGKVLRTLAQRGISRLLVEGGAKTAEEFIKAGEVDEFILFVAPKWIGEAEKINQALKVEELTARKIGPDILIRGRLKK
jgi:diaminohydroxyphosphoribosylaminopyrimidine deaminase/5-amino-6-(5-phosphoribosylamino)uracil reductase